MLVDHGGTDGEEHNEDDGANEDAETAETFWGPEVLPNGFGRIFDRRLSVRWFSCRR